MREFFGFGGYQRPVEGFLSIEHILFVSTLVIIMIIMGITLGVRNKEKDYKIKF